MANANNVNIRIIEEFERQQRELYNMVSKIAGSQASQQVGGGKDESSSSLLQTMKMLIESQKESQAITKELIKTQKESTSGMSNFTKALAFGGTGIAQTLSALGRGDILGAASGALNLGTGIGGALAAGGVGGAATMLAAIPLALMGMGVSRISGDFQQGFQNQQQVFQFHNMMGRGMPMIGSGAGAFGGEAFRQMAIQGLVSPGQAAGVGGAFLMGGGAGAQTNEGIRLFLQAQKNFGMSATELAKTIGELSHWGSKDNISEIFKDAGRAAFGVGAQGMFVSGEWQRSQAMLARVLTGAGGEVGNITRGGYGEMNRLLQIGNAFGLTPSMTGQAAAGVLQGMPSAFGNPAALAFLSANVGLSPFEMAFPTAEGTLGKITKWAGGGAQGSGFQNPTQMLLALQGTPLAPMSNLLSKMAFSDKFGVEGEKIKNMSDAEFNKALTAAMEGDKEKQAQIAQNTKQMADSMSEQGRTVVTALTSIQNLLQISTVGLVKMAVGLLGGGEEEVAYKAMRAGSTTRGLSGVFSTQSIKLAEQDLINFQLTGKEPGFGFFEKKFDPPDDIKLRRLRELNKLNKKRKEAGEKIGDLPDTTELSYALNKDKTENTLYISLVQEGSQSSNSVVRSNSVRGKTEAITIGLG